MRTVGNKLVLTGLAIMVSTTLGLAQEPAFTPVDSEIADEEVLRLVDPQYPGLGEVATAIQAGHLSQARELLVKHFATRTKPVIPAAEFPGVGEGNSMTVLPRSVDRKTADATWMRHVFTLSNNDEGKSETYDLGPKIDWTKNPSEALSWILYLNQLNHLAGLAALYRDTQDEKYVVEGGESVVSWTKQCPRAYGYMKSGQMVLSWMEVRNRLCNLIAAYEVVRKSPSLTPAMHMAFWKMFIACSRELVTYDGVSYPGLIPVAVMFPELTESKEWLAAGEANLRATLVDRTSPEGAWDTHSISYQTVPVPWSARVLEFLRANPESGDFGEVEAMVKTQIGKLLGIMLRLAMPNGALPNIGDTYGRPDWSPGHLNNLLTSYLFSQMSADERERLSKIADPFERLKATLAAREGPQAAEPAAASVAFPGTGYFVMRSSWQPKHARYLYFDLSPQALGHAHNDACHFDLYAYGKPLLVDTGDYFLGWGYRTALHNTIEVDCEQQARSDKAPMMPCEWLTTSGFDFVDGAHGAYEDRGVVHRRKVIFVKPDYFILCDLLTGEGTHKFEQFFHFAGPTQQEPAAAKLDEVTKSAVTSHTDTANVQVAPAYTDGLHAAFVEAHDTDMKVEDKFTREAMLGWMVTGGTFQRVKSPVAVYAREGEVPQSFYDVLFPTPAGGEAVVRVETLTVTENGTALTPEQAAGLVLHCRLRKPAHPPESIRTDLGDNLARGRAGFAEINQATIASTTDLLTNGDPGPRVIGAAVSSSPYTPNVHLSGRFSVDFGQATEVNTAIVHHGTWNGNAIIYPPEKMTVQYWDGTTWRDVTNAQTTWQEEHVATTVFDAVTTSRLSVAVERPSGGRLSMRELEAYRVSNEERRRVEALRHEMTTEEWTDVVLLSHGGPGRRQYGGFVFDGEFALIHKDSDGKLARISLKTGRELRERDQLLLESDNVLDSLTAEWNDDDVHVDCLALCGMRLLAQEAQRVEASGRVIPATREDRSLVLAASADRSAPQISDLNVQHHPPQKGMAGAQPSAVVTWKTDEPATSQVEFRDEGPDLVRRTILDTELTIDHEVTVYFLRPGAQHRFRAVSMDKWGNRAEAMA